MMTKASEFLNATYGNTSSTGAEELLGANDPFFQSRREEAARRIKALPKCFGKTGVPLYATSSSTPASKKVAAPT